MISTKKKQRHHSTMIMAIAIGVFAMLAMPARGSLIVEANIFQLQPEQANQTIMLFVNNTGSAVDVIGLNLEVQLGDGAPNPPGTQTGPAITAVNLRTGTIFQDNNSGSGGGGSITPQFFERGVLTDSETGPFVTLVPGPNKMATITISTVGYSSGNWPLTFIATPNGNSYYILNDVNGTRVT